VSLALDLLLALAVLVLALQAVAGAGLFRAIVMFIIFGLVMALAWARLGAPDLALAEAAIGAGITGALLLAALQRIARADDASAESPGTRTRSRLAAPLALLAAALVAALGLSLIEVEAGAGTAGALAREGMAGLSLGNPVTAVLLEFRGYDTLMEMAVLLAAFVGAFALRSGQDPDPRGPREAEVPLLGALLAAVVPLSVLVAVYLLYSGGHAPGGAFQAGAVLAAALVLLVLTRKLVATAAPGLLLRLGLVLGVLAFSVVGLAMLWREGQMLAMPGVWAVYLIETAMMISIAATLGLLFAGAGGLRRRGP
jgi:multisubunit Na+/H+ antiporter MnhB subunit